MSKARDKANSTVSNFASTGIDDNADANAITIDSSENVLVDKTSSNYQTVGHELRDGGRAFHTADGGKTLSLNRLSSPGDIVDFYQAGTLVGSLGTTGGDLTIDGPSEHTGLRFEATDITPRHNGSASNGVNDLGTSAARFKDLYLSGGAYIGGTGSANKLSDYEEGLHVTTATPSTSGTITLNSSADTMAYTKIGRLVLITGEISISSVSSPVGTVVDFTVPFACSSLSEQAERAGGGVFWTENGVGYHVIPFLTFSGSIIRIFKDASAFSANDSITFGVSYLTDS